MSIHLERLLEQRPERILIDTESQLVYSSPAIRERRRRILSETRKLIAERGYSGFSMEEICKKSNVAKRTLYNAYQTKERLVALAIHEYFERYLERLPYESESGTLQHNIERLVFVIQRNQQIKNYISAIMGIYFSVDAKDIWSTMHSMAVPANLNWLNALKARRQLHPWIDPETVVDDIIRLEYGVIHDWCRGHISDDKIAHHLVTTWLTFIAGITRTTARREIEQYLARIHETGQLIHKDDAAT